ncbi:MAG: hypothetical protein ACREX4_23650 [Gammaproteobacteria bacterium]
MIPQIQLGLPLAEEGDSSSPLKTAKRTNWSRSANPFHLIQGRHEECLVCRRKGPVDDKQFNDRWVYAYRRKSFMIQDPEVSGWRCP